MKKITSLILHVFFLIFFSAQSIAIEKKEYIIPASADLQYGRTIWMNTCESCHGYGVADAPIPMQPQDWKSRVTKGKQVLYRHAIDGFMGEDYSMMPARGGNEQLTDEQVKAAVDYMLFLANFYIKKEGEL